MANISIERAKKFYSYHDVINQTFLISNFEWRKYCSKKEDNGYADQVFLKQDITQIIYAKCFAVTKCRNDGKIHPVCYATTNLVDNFVINGLNGFIYGADELNRICKGIEFSRLKNVRSINAEDVSVIGEENFKDTSFWLASRSIDTDSYYTSFKLRYVFDGHVYKSSLFHSKGSVRDYSNICGIRPVFVLDSEVNPSLSHINWVDY